MLKIIRRHSKVLFSCIAIWIIYHSCSFLTNFEGITPIVKILSTDDGNQVTTESKRNLWRPTDDFENWDISYDDRVSAQLEYANTVQVTKKKRILVADSDRHGYYFGKFSTQEVMLEACPNMADACDFTQVGSHVTSDQLIGIDAVVITFGDTIKTLPRGNFTRIVAKTESSQFNTGVLVGTDLLCSYWRGSDFVMPYFRWTYYDPKVKSKKQDVNYAEGKTKLVAIFVSNCNTANGRMSYVEELQNHGLEVHVYGACGTYSCPRTVERTTCFNLLKADYKFYLAFENANCRDYITEKIANTAFSNNVIPVVMGAPLVDLVETAPQKSFIHVDSFPTTQALVDYLHLLDKNDVEYNKYFEWKGTGRRDFGFQATKPFCRFCAMLHYADKVAPIPVRTKPFDWNVGGHMDEEVNTRPCLPLNQHHWPSIRSDYGNIPNRSDEMILDKWLMTKD